MKTTTQLVSKDTKDGVSAKGPWLLAIFKAADGREYSTFKGDIASQANAFVGNGNVEVEYSEKQNGEFTNYTLLGVSAVTDSSPAPAPVVAQAASSKDEQIARSVGIKLAVETFFGVDQDPLQGLVEVAQLADFYAGYILNGDTGE